MQKEKLIYFDSIDFFRALGVFFVFLHHAIQVYGFAQNTYLGPYLYYSTAFMWSGVNLFFLASGFINGRNLFSRQSKVNFLKKRGKRILPLYYVYMLIGTIGYIFNYKFFSINDFNILNHFLFLSGVDCYNSNIINPIYFSITWTLSVEIQLYMITAMIMAIKKIHTLTIIIILFMIGLISPYLSSGINHFGLIMHLDEYFLGVIIRFLIDGKLLHLKKIKTINIFVLLITLFLIYITDLNENFQMLDSTLLLFYSSLLLLLLNLRFNKLSFILVIGRNCYFIYLFHFLFLYIFAKFFDEHYRSNYIILFISFVSCYYVSRISMKYFESKFTNE